MAAHPGGLCAPRVRSEGNRNTAEPCTRLRARAPSGPAPARAPSGAGDAVTRLCAAPGRSSEPVPRPAWARRSEASRSGDSVPGRRSGPASLRARAPHPAPSTPHPAGGARRPGGQCWPRASLRVGPRPRACGLSRGRSGWFSRTSAGRPFPRARAPCCSRTGARRRDAGQPGWPVPCSAGAGRGRGPELAARSSPLSRPVVCTGGFSLGSSAPGSPVPGSVLHKGLKPAAGSGTWVCLLQVAPAQIDFSKFRKNKAASFCAFR